LAWRTFQPTEWAMPDDDGPKPSRTGMTVLQGVAFTVGIVVGIGIFKSPQLVAQSVTSEAAFILLWIAGGLVTLVGALVYAELGAAFPSGGGEYHFISRALGRPAGLLFAWARVTVLQTGIIAAVAFVFGDYAQQLVPLGPWGPAIYAALALAILTLVNLLGAPEGKGFQLALTSLTLAVIFAVVIAGLWLSPGLAPPPPASPASAALGLALVFVLLTYGGWTEAAYLSGDLHNVQRNMVRVLVFATAVITLIYVLMNLAYLNVLGLEGIRTSNAVGADAVRKVAGTHGAIALALVICAAALSALNGTIFTGARLYRAVGNDLPMLKRLGLDASRGGSPTVAFAAQGAVAMSLIVFGAMTRDGFQAMVAYTAPVFWLFLLLVGISFFVLRRREPHHARPFRAPFYPLIPGLFCLTCAYLLYASLAYTGRGALVGVTVLLIGVPVVWLTLPRPSMERP
jgi:amino acid transporter